MREYKIVKCQHYGPTANKGSVWFEVHELKRFLWFPRWKPITETKRIGKGEYLITSAVTFGSQKDAEECIERLQAHKPNTTVREDVPLDCRH